MDGLDHDGVASIEVTNEIEPANPSEGTAALLSTGRHVLTAAHVFDIPNGSRLDFDVAIVKWHRPDGPPIDSQVNNFANVWTHDDYEFNSLGQFGYDVAILELPNEVDPDVTRYELAPPDSHIFGEEVLMAGYGRTGNGHNGVDESTSWGQEKRVGKNRLDEIALPQDYPLLRNHHTLIGWKFDPGAPDGFGDEEVTIAPGDSGGPIFINAEGGERVIASVISATAGDVQFGTWFDAINLHEIPENDLSTQQHEAPTTILDWIGAVTGISSRLVGVSGSSFDDPTAWAFDAPPGTSAAVYVTGDRASSTIYDGPSTSTEVGSVLVGRGLDVKTFDLNHTGSFTVNGDVTVDTNGQIGLRRGALVADRLIVQGTTPAPGPPQPEAGLFIWTDLDELGSSSITVTSIEVRDGGDFVHDWFDTNTGTLDAEQMSIAELGRAFFEWDASGIEALVNEGVLSLGQQAVGNQLSVDSFTQTQAGLTHLAIRSTSGTGLLADSMTVTDDVTLAGALDLDLAPEDTLTLGQTFDIITASSVTGFFRHPLYEEVDGLRLKPFYDATSVWLEVVEYYLLGDMNLDGVVDSVDVSPFTLALTDPQAYITQYGVEPLLVGDINHDAVFDAVDVAAFVELLTGGSSVVATVPEPGTVALVAAGGVMVGRRRRMSPAPAPRRISRGFEYQVG